MQTSTKSSNITNYEPHEPIEGIVRTFLLVVFLVLLISAVIANIILVFNAWRHYTKRFPLFMVGVIALSDCAMATISIPIQLHYNYNETWTYGHAGCKILPWIFSLPHFLVTYCILLISFYRWTIARSLPTLEARLRESTGLIVIGICTIALLTTLPVVIFSRIVVEETTTKLKCMEDWSDIGWKYARGFFGLYVLSFQIMLPLTLTCAIHLNLHKMLKIGGMFLPRNREQFRKGSRILLATVIGMAITWVPEKLYWLLLDFEVITETDITTIMPLKIFETLMQLITSLSCLINPFLFGMVTSSNSLLPQMGTSQNDIIGQCQPPEPENRIMLEQVPCRKCPTTSSRHSSMYIPNSPSHVESTKSTVLKQLHYYKNENVALSCDFSGRLLTSDNNIRSVDVEASTLSM